MTVGRDSNAFFFRWAEGQLFWRAFRKMLSFAFNSNLTAVNGDRVTVSQTRQWSLTDIAGASSAFFAGDIATQIQAWEQDPLLFFADFGRLIGKILAWIKSHLPVEQQAKAIAIVDQYQSSAGLDLSALSFPNPLLLIPEYGYWPVLNPTVVANPKPTSFADGGSIENTGINALLAYDDIFGVIAFVNSPQPLIQSTYGIWEGENQYTPGTNVLVNDSIPPLFGYQPYADGTDTCKNQGYVPYVGHCVDSSVTPYANNQVFPSESFATFLQDIWKTANTGGSNAAPAIFSKTLTTVGNSWFRVEGGRQVTLVWCYLNYVEPWFNLFAENAAVTAFIQNDVKTNNFPNYPTKETCLTATQINLMSNLAAWSVITAEKTNQTFSSLFKPGFGSR
jgi:hypothetical protein